MTGPFKVPAAVDAASWRRYAAALVLGFASALALPPFYVVPLLWPGLVGLCLLTITAASWRQAALVGWLFGVGWFAFGLYWIANAFLVDAERYGFLAPVAVVGMAVGMAIYPALAAVALWQFMKRYHLPAWGVVTAFASLWTLAEWLRGWLLTGFPWNPLSSVWVFSGEMLQGAALLGALGLSFVTALVFTAPVLLFSPSLERRRARALVLVASALLPLFWMGGWLRLSGAGTVTRPDINLRIVQPSIPQADKWRPELRQGHVIRQMAMSKRRPGPAGAPTHVIWAETNVPFLLGPEPEIVSSLAATVPEQGHLIFGAPRRSSTGDVFNSLFVIDGQGDVNATFDKFHLVPFGEYVPLRWILPFGKLVESRGDFTPGPGPTTLKVDGLPPFSPVICYEIIFAGDVIDSADRPEWILNITNDGWFGASTGPRQHLVQARLRAIEEGLPVVRAANSGISAVIDAYGRVRNSLGLGEQGVVDAPLPVALSRTPFAFLGHWPALLLTVIGLLAGIVPTLRRRIVERG